MAGLQPFNYGNTMAQAENIRGGRINNALNEQKLGQNALNPGGVGGMEDTAQIKNYNFYQKLSPEGRNEFDHILRGQNIKKVGEVWNIVTPDNQLIPLGSLAQEIDAKNQTAYATASGGQQATVDFQPQKDLLAIEKAQEIKDIDLSMNPQIARQTASATVQGKAEGTRKTPEYQQKMERRLADNNDVMVSIDELLAPRAGGGIYASYAYGRLNAATPDLSKPTAWVDAEAVRDRVVASLQLENVVKLKGTGPITENEQKILKQAASVLSNPLISAQLVEKELKRVRALFSTWAKGNKDLINKGGEYYEDTPAAPSAVGIPEAQGGWTIEEIQ